MLSHSTTSPYISSSTFHCLSQHLERSYIPTNLVFYKLSFLFFFFFCVYKLYFIGNKKDLMVSKKKIRFNYRKRKRKKRVGGRSSQPCSQAPSHPPLRNLHLTSSPSSPPQTETQPQIPNLLPINNNKPTSTLIRDPSLWYPCKLECEYFECVYYVVRTVSDTLWTKRCLMFPKQLKLRDHYGDLTMRPISISERKIC